MDNFDLPIALDGADPSHRRAMIASLAETMASLPAEHQRSVEPINHFGGGVYARELFVGEGTVVVGMIHKRENMLMLIKGDATIYTETSSFRIQAPKIMVSPPGVQRVAYGHTDCIFVSVLAVGEERDVAKIEQEFVTTDLNDLALIEGGE